MPKLDHNLLSVGQLLSGDYTVVFDDHEYIIKNKETVAELARLNMSEHKLFPLTINEVRGVHVAFSKIGESHLLHERYGHLNINNLQQLSREKLVDGLPEIIATNPCEGCA